MRAFLIIAFVLLTATGFGQRSVGNLATLSLESLEDRSLTNHSGILPSPRQWEYELQQKKATEAYPERVDSYHHIRFNPDFAAQYDTSLFHRAAAGVSVEVLYRRKFYTRVMLSTGWSTREGLNQIHPAVYPLHNRNEFIYFNLRSRICYTPNRFLHVAVGTDNQFFGQGYRSLIQGDQAAPNPFAMMRVTVWRFEYGLLYQLFNERTDSNTRLFKFGATHYLSYNVTKNWNVGLFETVLFQPTDGSFNRAVEVEYLNPLVFFRPQEYSLGSTDNVIVGLQTSYSFDKHVVYGQLVLDEFVLKEIRSRSRWWANKYGAQLGIKGKLGELKYRLEGNLMRPYTYAHINNGQNGGNNGYPIAHPLGANFVEVLAQLQAPMGKQFQCKAYGVFQLQGLDEDSVSWGGDVYQSYSLRPMEFGHTIGQGITMRTLRFGCELQYEWSTLHSLVYIDPQIAFHWGELPSTTTPAVTIGWRSQLFQERKQF
jgi:hypothetical protein